MNPPTKGEQEAIGHAQDEGVPALVFLVGDGVDGIADEQRE